ncbi:MAG: FecR family protein [Elusimicrobiota bacterium]
MKKVLGIVVAALISVTLAAAVVVAAEVFVSETVGTPQVLHFKATSWAPMKKDMRLQEKDVLRTNRFSRVELSFSNGTKAAVTEKSVLGIAELNPKKFSIAMNLLTGKVRSEVSKLGKGDKYAIRTPTAVCAVRGTLYNVESNNPAVYNAVFADELGAAPAAPAGAAGGAAAGGAAAGGAAAGAAGAAGGAGAAGAAAGAAGAAGAGAAAGGVAAGAIIAPGASVSAAAVAGVVAACVASNPSSIAPSLASAGIPTNTLEATQVSVANGAVATNNAANASAAPVVVGAGQTTQTNSNGTVQQPTVMTQEQTQSVTQNAMTAPIQSQQPQQTTPGAQQQTAAAVTTPAAATAATPAAAATTPAAATTATPATTPATAAATGTEQQAAVTPGAPVTEQQVTAPAVTQEVVTAPETQSTESAGSFDLGDLGAVGEELKQEFQSFVSETETSNRDVREITQEVKVEDFAANRAMRDVNGNLVRVEQKFSRPNAQSMQFTNIVQRKDGYNYGSNSITNVTYNGTNASRTDSLEITLQFNKELPEQIAEWGTFIKNNEKDFKLNSMQAVVSNSSGDQIKSELKLTEVLNTNTNQLETKEDAHIYLNSREIKFGPEGVPEKEPTTGITKNDAGDISGGSLWITSEIPYQYTDGAKELGWLTVQGFAINNDGNVYNFNSLKDSVSSDLFGILKNVAIESIFSAKIGKMTDYAYRGDDVFIGKNIDLIFTPDIITSIVLKIPNFTELTSSSSSSSNKDSGTVDTGNTGTNTNINTIPGAISLLRLY